MTKSVLLAGWLGSLAMLGCGGPGGADAVTAMHDVATLPRDLVTSTDARDSSVVAPGDSSVVPTDDGGSADAAASDDQGSPDLTPGPDLTPPIDLVIPPDLVPLPDLTVPTCTDGIKNGMETDVDCGGPTCPRCAATKMCMAPTDCLDGVCTTNVCIAATCVDAVKNGMETDVDCGGPKCTACPNDKMCMADSDCMSIHCKTNLCVMASCTDGVKDGTETDVDCGGPVCARCGDLKMCMATTDCFSGVCKTNQCQVPTCTDSVKNGSETDIDCGGSCPKCADLKMCMATTDCSSGVCKTNQCQAPTCSDGVKNGTESDIDCGGSCTACGLGKACKAGTDCVSATCTGGKCVSGSYGSGQNGALAVSANTTFTGYAETHLAAAATSGSTSVSVKDATGITAGSKLLLVNVRSAGGNEGKWEVADVSSVNGSMVTLNAGLTQSYPEAANTLVRTLPQYTTVTIASGATLAAAPWSSSTLSGGIVAFFATGMVTVSGTVSAKGMGYGGGIGDSNDPGSNLFKMQGESYLGVGAANQPNNSPNGGGGNGGVKRGGCEGSGGGGGGYGAVGQGGGNNTVNCGDSLPGAVGGKTYGDANLARIHYGSGGGSGGYTVDPNQGRGGNGGGMVLIFANQIIIGGSIDASGASGTAEYSDYGGGGGGSGGSVYLRHQQPVMGASNVNVGGGGGGGANGRSETGGSGGAGRSASVTFP